LRPAAGLAQTYFFVEAAHLDLVLAFEFSIDWSLALLKIDLN
jgi:hypothetical protein